MAETREGAVETLCELTGPRDPTEPWSSTGTGRTLTTWPSGAWTQQKRMKFTGLTYPQHSALSPGLAHNLTRHRVGHGSQCPQTPKWPPGATVLTSNVNMEDVLRKMRKTKMGEENGRSIQAVPKGQIAGLWGHCSSAKVS